MTPRPFWDTLMISPADRKSTRLNSSHSQISYAVFCLYKNHIQNIPLSDPTVAKEETYQVKLVAQSKKLQNVKVPALALPQFMKNDDHLSFVKHDYNGV